METLYWLIPGRAILHLCAHVIGIHLFIMSEVRSRSTFLKVGQAIMHGKDLEVEKALKERMIHSVMPRRVADELMKQSDDDNDNSVKRYFDRSGHCGRLQPKEHQKQEDVDTSRSDHLSTIQHDTHGAGQHPFRRHCGNSPR